jgi:hypothetical protein
MKPLRHSERQQGAGMISAPLRFRRTATSKEYDMLRVSFSSMTTARAAVNVLEAYGYSAKQLGRDVVTDCPTLLAVPVIQKRVGFAEIEHLDLSAGTRVEPSGEAVA